MPQGVEASTAVKQYYGSTTVLQLQLDFRFGVRPLLPRGLFAGVRSVLLEGAASVFLTGTLSCL